MKLLVLGGTAFLGRHVVEAALAAGHAPTLFNRGRRAPGLFPALRTLVGDRNGDAAALRGQRFDAVIDLSGYTPRHVATVLDALGTDAIGHYVFVSSISVCRAFPPGCAYDEAAPVADGHEGYGPLKARSEEALAAALPGRLSCVRPGLIVGPHDPTGRFTYWPRRVARGGAVLAPGRPGRPVQWIDARDLAAWCVQLAERRQGGVFHAVGPREVLTMLELLETCRDVANSDARWVWRSDAELRADGVAPWTGLPLWLPEDDADFGGMLLARCERALQAGLRLRPLADTVRATLDWDRARDPPVVGEVETLSAGREAELLADAA
ncbi:NAD-dependent epimerase/dehydratase family protein [uncultured Methylibium sp.]|uniref:NAD-dependent epimerase/dehydratase family protein n=1 Tax=uncultured Methylibium sp. TaxID=381093 RepID=UPI0025EAF641|nr:NAD-dependent epimerase/dehydratase family protein [uncultured Methylibium sp.]